jgi:hypothetical protein
MDALSSREVGDGQGGGGSERGSVKERGNERVNVSVIQAAAAGGAGSGMNRTALENNQMEKIFSALRDEIYDQINMITKIIVLYQCKIIIVKFN